jgi:hypothetical protein
MLNEEVKKYRELSGDTNPNTSISRIGGYLDGYEKALEKTHWIPVSERLPKAGEYVGGVAKFYLIQNKYGDMLVARYTHSRYWEQIYQLEPIEDEIVAWMPLPKPYKAESEDKE